jgi:hypothetical protein
MASFDFSAAAAAATTTDGNEGMNPENGTSHPPIETRKVKSRARKMPQRRRKGQSEGMEIESGMEVENGMGSENDAVPGSGTPTATDDDEMLDVSLAQHSGVSDLNSSGHGPGRPTTPDPTIPIPAVMAVDTSANESPPSHPNARTNTTTTSQASRSGANAIPVVSRISQLR